MIHLVPGDATLPLVNPPWCIAHVVNDVGAWGKGFVVALGARWPQVRSAYKRQWRLHKLGDVQLIPLDNGRCVANMFAQRGIDRRAGKPPIRYGALRRALRNVHDALGPRTTVHMPRIGCGLAGGRWDNVEAIVGEELSEREVYVYGGGPQRRGRS